MTVVKSLGGIDPESIGLKILRESERPILPTTRDTLVTIPGRNGAWDFGADLEAKYFNLSCAFLTRNSSTLQTAIEALTRLLMDGHGKPKTVELIFFTRPDRTYYVRYSGSTPIYRIVGMGTFMLPLIASDPHSYGPTEISEPIISTSPEKIHVVSSGDIVADTLIELTNIGSTTINSFKIQNEYQIE